MAVQQTYAFEPEVWPKAHFAAGNDGGDGGIDPGDGCIATASNVL